MKPSNAITMDFKYGGRPPTKADFSYRISPDTIEIVDTGQGQLSVEDDLEAVIRLVEYWHMSSVRKFKVICQDPPGARHEVQWDGRSWIVTPAKEGEQR